MGWGFGNDWKRMVAVGYHLRLQPRCWPGLQSSDWLCLGICFQGSTVVWMTSWCWLLAGGPFLPMWVVPQAAWSPWTQLSFLRVSIFLLYPAPLHTHFSDLWKLTDKQTGSTLCWLILSHEMAGSRKGDRTNRSSSKWYLGLLTAPQHATLNIVLFFEGFSWPA